MLGDTAGHISGHSHSSKDYHSELQQITLHIAYEARDNIRWRDIARSDKSEYIVADTPYSHLLRTLLYISRSFNPS